LEAFGSIWWRRTFSVRHRIAGTYGVMGLWGKEKAIIALLEKLRVDQDPSSHLNSSSFFPGPVLLPWALSEPFASCFQSPSPFPS
jgi:hypothetical protein